MQGFVSHLTCEVATAGANLPLGCLVNIASMLEKLRLRKAFLRNNSLSISYLKDIGINLSTSLYMDCNTAKPGKIAFENSFKLRQKLLLCFS